MHRDPFRHIHEMTLDAAATYLDRVEADPVEIAHLAEAKATVISLRALLDGCRLTGTVFRALTLLDTIEAAIDALIAYDDTENRDHQEGCRATVEISQWFEQERQAAGAALGAGAAR